MISNDFLLQLDTANLSEQLWQAFVIRNGSCRELKRWVDVLGQDRILKAMLYMKNQRARHKIYRKLRRIEKRGNWYWVVLDLIFGVMV